MTKMSRIHEKKNKVFEVVGEGCQRIALTQILIMFFLAENDLASFVIQFSGFMHFWQHSKNDDLLGYVLYGSENNLLMFMHWDV